MLRPRARSASAAARLSPVLAALLALSLAACGSQLDPATVAQTSGSGLAGAPVSGTEGGTEVTGAGGTTTGSTGSGGTASGTTGSSGTTGGSGGGGSTGGGGEAGGGGTEGTGDNAADGGVKAASCKGFKNGTGITDDSIVIGNASDISGPVPGLFESAQDAVKAYVTYFNSTNDICGRKLELRTYDSRADAAADQQNYTKGCNETFAMVGSMSAFDSGGAAVAENCGLPDIRSAAVTQDRYDCSTCFGAQSTKATEFQNAVADYVKKNHPKATSKGGMTYVKAGAASENAAYQSDALSKRGLKMIYDGGIDVTEFNYAPYVQQMKDKGVEYVQMIASTAQFVRLAKAMQQQGYDPEVFMLDPTAYTPEFLSSGGDAVEGATLFLNFTPFEEAASNQEVQLYLNWLQQVKPGATPTFFGLFSWSAARLFVQQAVSLGGKLTRASMVESLKGVDDWTANGMHAPQHVGAKRTGDCWRFVQVKGGKFVPVGGTKYTCAGTTTVG